MDRYLVFIADVYYPDGGFRDFVGDFSDKNEAIKKAMTVRDLPGKWSHVYDTETRKIIFEI